MRRAAARHSANAPPSQIVDTTVVVARSGGLVQSKPQIAGRDADRRDLHIADLVFCATNVIPASRRLLVAMSDEKPVSTFSDIALAGNHP
jgi:hypothetical protein